MKTIITFLMLCSLAFAQGLGGKAGMGGKGGFGRGAVASSASVAQSSGCYAGTTSCAVTLGSAVTAGHRVFVYQMSNNANSTPTMTGETFVHETGAAGCSNNTADTVDCWLDTSAVGGQTSLTCTATGVYTMCVVIETTDPQNLSTPADAGGNGNNTGATSFSISTSAATTQAGDIVIGCFTTGANSTAFSAGSPYTQVIAETSGGAFNMMCEQYAPGATGTQTATATNSNSARATYGILAIKP
jgi:hypothetical protein